MRLFMHNPSLVCELVVEELARLVVDVLKVAALLVGERLPLLPDQ